MDLNSVFKNLKVIEIAGILAGPLCGKFFAELGAEVIKIENPNSKGDATRSWKNEKEKYHENVSSYYAAANYNKKVKFLNLKEKEDYEVFANEVKNADVIISNFYTAKAQKLKVDFETIKKINPNIIYAQLIGYFQDETRPAFDAVLQAETGFIDLNGEKESAGLKIPFAFIDVFANHQLREAILLALYQQTKTKRAYFIEVSLFQSAVSALINQASNYLSNNVIPQKQGSLHPNIAPYGETFFTSDKQQIILAVGSDNQFHNLLECLDLKEFKTDQRFESNQKRVENRNELKNILSKKIATYPTQKLLQNFKKANVPTGLISNLKQVFENPEAQQMILTETIEQKELRSVKTVAFRME